MLYYTVRYNGAGESSCFEVVEKTYLQFLSSHNRQHDCTDCTKLCNTVYYAVLPLMNDYIHSKHVEQTKNCVINMIVRIVHLCILRSDSLLSCDVMALACSLSSVFRYTILLYSASPIDLFACTR